MLQGDTSSKQPHAHPGVLGWAAAPCRAAAPWCPQLRADSASTWTDGLKEARAVPRSVQPSWGGHAAQVSSWLGSHPVALISLPCLLQADVPSSNCCYLFALHRAW